MKSRIVVRTKKILPSHPAWGAWIEIAFDKTAVEYGKGSHPAWGAWIEILLIYTNIILKSSHPAWGAWIEIRKNRF